MSINNKTACYFSITIHVKTYPENKNAEENALTHICVYLVIKISVSFHLIAYLQPQHKYIYTSTRLFFENLL